MRACDQGSPGFPGGALICLLNGLVVYDQVVVSSLVVRGVLRFLCVQLGTMLQLCARTRDGCELHVAHYGPCNGCIVSEDSKELQWHRPP